MVECMGVADLSHSQPQEFTEDVTNLYAVRTKVEKAIKGDDDEGDKKGKGKGKGKGKK